MKLSEMNCPRSDSVRTTFVPMTHPLHRHRCVNCGEPATDHLLPMSAPSVDAAPVMSYRLRCTLDYDPNMIDGPHVLDGHAHDFDATGFDFTSADGDCHSIMFSEIARGIVVVTFRAE